MGLNDTQKKERSEYLERNLDITECSQKKPYVFISYASDNWETVFKTAIIPMQQRYGLRVYADKAFDKVNDKWIVPMLRNVRGADAVVAFVSQSYIESYACFLEMLTAVNNRKPIVFVSLEDTLRLGDTTDQPIIERGAKNEILNQGANISTNTNNTSNDIMRAMKSAYTSISTLLEQDALSKYDISDAFINFFRDASINRKTINDLRAVKGTISSVSNRVFDPSLVSEQPKAAPVYRPAAPVQPTPAPVQPAPAPAQPTPAPAQPESAPAQPEFAPAQPEPVPVPAQPEPAPVQPEPVPAYTAAAPAQPEPNRAAWGAAPEQKADFSFSDNEKAQKAKKPGGKKILLGALAGVAVVVLLFIFIGLSGPKEVTDQPYTLLTGKTVSYTGPWKDDRPADGQGVATGENGFKYEGEFKDGNPNGQATVTYADGRSYVGEWGTSTERCAASGQGVYKNSTGDVFDGVWDLASGKMLQGKKSYANGDTYEGTWDKEGTFLKGTITYADGTVKQGQWNAEKGIFTGTFTNEEGAVYELGETTTTNGESFVGSWDPKTHQFVRGKLSYSNGDVYDGDWADGYYNGKGTKTYANGDVFEGKWENGTLIEGTLTYADGTVHKKGTLTYKEGYRFEGIWDDATQRWIEGKKILDDGTIYDGEWGEKYFKKGTITYASGNVYEGEYADGNLNGQGTMTYADGYVSTGEWKDGILVKGTITDKEGTVYEKGTTQNKNGETFVGTWNKSTGYFVSGKLTYSNGDIYDGMWKDGYYYGQGKKTQADGVIFEGEWAKGRLVKGTKTLANGTVYDGEWGEKYFSKGTIKYANGDVYEGEFADGYYNGQGTLTHADGTVESGTWVNGKLQK